MSSATATASLFEALLLGLTPAMPLILASALLGKSTRALVIRLAPWATLPALIAAGVASSALLDMPWLLLGGRLGVDETGRVFLFLTSVLWLLAGIYARYYLADDKRIARFFAYYLLTMSGNLGLIVAQDALVFYSFFVLMSLSSYGLIVHRQDGRALRAGRIYIYLFVLGEVLLFSGLVIGVRHAGTLDLNQFQESIQSDLVIALLFVGFGIKAGALPLHSWLPLAHTAAPTPASAVLSGAMINAGLLGWLRFLPMGHMALPEWSVVCISAGLGAAIYGVFVGLSQDQPKTVLAYSSISQMGLMTFALGIGMAAPVLWPLCLAAILLYGLHHALAKGALFLGAGVAAAAGKGTLQRKWVLAGLLLPALAISSLPFTSGAVAKLGLKSLTHILPEAWSGWMALLLSLITVGTSLLMIRFLYLVWFEGSERSRLPPGLWLPWAALLANVALCTWLWPGAQDAALQTLSAAAFWQALWPAGAAAMIARAAWIWSRRPGARVTWHIPPGDILILGEYLAKQLELAWSQPAHRLFQRIREKGQHWRRSLTILVPDPDSATEYWLQRWEMSGVLIVIIVITITIMLALA